MKDRLQTVTKLKKNAVAMVIEAEQVLFSVVGLRKHRRRVVPARRWRRSFKPA